MTMLAERYELKFPAASVACQALLDAARPGLVADAHGDDATYRIASLYFDTADMRAYWEKLDGEKVRRKFRLRYYSLEDPEEGRVGVAFMEIKHRIDNTVYKERVRLIPESGSLLLREPRLLPRLAEFVDPVDSHRQATVASIVTAATRNGFGPACVVTYVRRAFEGRRDKRLRVTVDTNVRGLVPSGAFDVGVNGGELLLPEDQAVLEVKFDGAIPRWVRDLLARSGLRLQRFSKYAAAVEALGLVENRLRPRQSSSPSR